MTALLSTRSTRPRARSLTGEIATPGLRVGLYGGTFDPPHAGHLHVARTAAKRLGLDRVWWLPSSGHPLKPAGAEANFDARFAATAALARDPRFSVADLEARLNAGYALPVIEAILERRSGARFALIMGADNWALFHRWRAWRRVAAIVPIAVVARPDWTLPALCGPAARALARRRLPDADAGALVDSDPPAWVFLSARLHPASSTALRAARAEPLALR